LQAGERVWLTELQLGIGRERGTHVGITRDWLYWYNQQGNRYLTAEERLQQSQQKIQQLEEQLRRLGINPNQLD
jgi:aminoglycoside phosphotransferase